MYIYIILYYIYVTSISLTSELVQFFCSPTWVTWGHHSQKQVASLLIHTYIFELKILLRYNYPILQYTTLIRELLGPGQLNYFLHKKHFQQFRKENTEEICEFNRNHGPPKNRLSKKIFERVKRVAPRACQKLLEKVKSVASKGCQKLLEKVKSVASRACQKLLEKVKSVAPRACQKFLEKVHSIASKACQKFLERHSVASRACWNAGERTLLTHPTPPHLCKT